MSWPYWVIREGVEHGRGRYLQSSVYERWGDRESSAMFFAAEDAREWIAAEPSIAPARVIRVVRKTKGDLVDRALYQEALDKLASAVNERDELRRKARGDALTKAERICRQGARAYSRNEVAFAALESAANAIAALRAGRRGRHVCVFIDAQTITYDELRRRDAEDSSRNRILNEAVHACESTVRMFSDSENQRSAALICASAIERLKKKASDDAVVSVDLVFAPGRIRDEALAEAERACVGDPDGYHPLTPGECADAIAALRGAK